MTIEVALRAAHCPKRLSRLVQRPSWSISCTPWNMSPTHTLSPCFSWYNHLDPAIRKGPWTPLEDTLIYELHARIGNRWSDIAKTLNGRYVCRPSMNSHADPPLATRTLPAVPPPHLLTHQDRQCREKPLEFHLEKNARSGACASH